MNEKFMKEKPVFPLIMSMATPMVISMLVNSLYNIVDSFFVAKIGEDAITALSLVYPVQNLVNALAIGFGVGLNAVIAFHLGAGEKEAADTAATHGFLFSILHGIIAAAVSIPIMRPFLKMFTQSENVISLGVRYSTIVFSFSIVIMISLAYEKIFQAVGRMNASMAGLMTGCIVNIILDPLLIFGVGPFPELGVMGAAIATVFGQFCSMIFALLIIFLKSHMIKITFKNFKFSMQTIKNIYAVGFPSIIMQSIGSIMIVGLNGILASSEASVTVLGVYYKLQSFVFMPCFGLNQGVMPIIGYNYGARNRKRVYSALKRGIIIGVIIMTLGTIAMWAIPEQLISMFGGTDELMKIGVPAFRIISLCFIPAAAGIIFTTLFQAVGKGIRSLIMSFARQLVLILPIAFIFSKIWGLGTVWYAFPIAEIFSLAIAIGFFINLVKGDFKKLG